MITQDELKRILEYDQDTGLFIWKVRARQNVKIGDIAGSTNNKGYIAIKIKCKSYKAHRLVWLYMYGFFPKDQIDHINRTKDDNRLCNLREVNNRENCCNRLREKKGTLIGASFNKKRGKWVAQIYNKKTIYLGEYKTELEAHNKYIEKRRELENDILTEGLPK